MGWTGCSRCSVGCGDPLSRSSPMDQTSQTPPTDLAVIGIDIGKEVFHLIGLSRDGKVVLRRKIRRLGLTDIFKKLPPGLPRGHGGVPERALCQPHLARARP